MRYNLGFVLDAERWRQTDSLVPVHGVIGEILIDKVAKRIKASGTVAFVNGFVYVDMEKA